MDTPTATPPLADRATTLGDAATAAIAWVETARTHAHGVEQQAPGLMDELWRIRNNARKLARAARRRMCVGVFGPSQAGKSYLVSILARHPEATQPLQVRFGGGLHDFLKEINPPGNRESTGLVTRITLHPTPTPAAFPVELQLLTQTDIVKILANSFLSDFDHDKAAELTPPTPGELHQRLEELRALARPDPTDPLTEEEVFDLQEYFDAYFPAKTRELRLEFWPAARTLAPRLEPEQRARLWSLLWYDFPPFTRLYRQLYAGLARLGFAATAHAPMTALIPREHSIIDVLTLDRLGRDDDDPLTLATPHPGGGEPVTAQLPRSLVAALTAELRIVVAQRPWPFLEHTDLLDFPGARSRLKLTGPAEALPPAPGGEGHANPLRELLLRGKVAYLFQRYSAERELNAILLCIPDGNQEVRDLGEMVEKWIEATQGSTPETRARQRNSLFLVLTKMDREFELKAGEVGESRKLRWKARLDNSLLKNFRGSWTTDWDGRPFNNTYWLRNPTVIDERIMAYDGEGRELGLAPGFVQRHGELRAFFVADPAVRTHFASPPTAWDQAFRPNDGGIAHLVEQLTPVCDPRIKAGQLAGQWGELARRFHQRLGIFFAGDADAERRKKQEQINTVLNSLALTVQRGQLGELLAALQVGARELRELYFQVATLQTTTPPEGGGSPAPRIEAVGGVIDIQSLLGEVLGEEAPPIALTAPMAQDRATRFAEAAVQHWIRTMRRRGGNPRLLHHLAITPEAFGFVVDELAVGAHRSRLVERIAEAVRAPERNVQAKWEELADRQVRRAGGLINQHVDWLGFAELPLEERPGLPPRAPVRRVFQPLPEVTGPLPVAEEGVPAYANFCKDWLRAFIVTAMDNVGFAGGREITPELNDRLGAILARVAPGTGGE